MEKGGVSGEDRSVQLTLWLAHIKGPLTTAWDNLVVINTVSVLCICIHPVQQKELSNAQY